MRQIFSNALCLVAVAACATLAADPPINLKGKFGIGYDEGIALSYHFSDRTSIMLAGGYTVTGADTVNRQPLGRANAKLCLSSSFVRFGPVELTGFIDVQGGLVQEELGPINGSASYTRVNIWGGRARLGLSPELFFGEHFSLSYRFGGALFYNGTKYKLNSNKSSTEATKSDYLSGGVFGDPLNLGFHIYF